MAFRMLSAARRAHPMGLTTRFGGSMACFQCEQTENKTGCTVVGVYVHFFVDGK